MTIGRPFALLSVLALLSVPAFVPALSAQDRAALPGLSALPAPLIAPLVYRTAADCERLIADGLAGPDCTPALYVTATVPDPAPRLLITVSYTDADGVTQSVSQSVPTVRQASQASQALGQRWVWVAGTVFVDTTEIGLKVWVQRDRGYGPVAEGGIH